jgi:hypothetical protein
MTTKLKVISVESMDKDKELFILKGDILCEVLLSRTRQRDTFIYLMKCLKFNCEVNRNKLFAEVKERWEKTYKEEAGE